MATQTLKQRFLDILFEDDEDDAAINEEPKEKVVREVPRVKASDLLYGKKENKPLIIKEEKKIEPKVEQVAPKEKVNKETFINYAEDIKENTKHEVRSQSVDEIYISQPALSPIFGNVEKDKKNKKDETVSVDYASVDKPNSNHLGIVLSPIYGYDTAKVEEVKEPVKKKEESFKDKDITTDLGDIFATDEFKQEAFNEEEEKEKTAEIDLFSDFYTTKE